MFNQSKTVFTAGCSHTGMHFPNDNRILWIKKHKCYQFLIFFRNNNKYSDVDIRIDKKNDFHKYFVDFFGIFFLTLSSWVGQHTYICLWKMHMLYDAR